MLSFNSMHDIMNQFTLYLIHSKLLPKENKLLNLMINLWLLISLSVIYLNLINV